MRGNLRLSPRFRDRAAAGAELADELNVYQRAGPVVLGIPRGGVLVGAEVARELGAQLDVVVARTVPVPGEPQFSIGAVTVDGSTFLDDDAIRRLGLSEKSLAGAITRATEEARGFEALYRGSGDLPSLEARVAIVVDDGLAPAIILGAAVRAVRKREPSKVVVAVPVATRQACATLLQEADTVICCAIRSPFIGVGAYYDHFERVSDAQVIEALRGTKLAQAA